MTTAREVVDACASLLRDEEAWLRHVRLITPWSHCLDKEQDYWRGQALAVIRTLATQEPTDRMMDAMLIHSGPEPAFQGALTALADGYEREREGGG